MNELGHTIFCHTRGPVYGGVTDAIACAKKFSGTEVIYLSPEQGSYDIRCYLEEFSPFRRSYLSKCHPDCISLAQLRIASIERWFVLKRYLEDNSIDSPVFAPDWDVLIFQDMRDAYKPFSDYDFTSCSVYAGGNLNWSAAYHVKGVNILDKFVASFRAMLDGCDSIKWNDMSIWSSLQANRGQINKIVNGSTFDANMHADTNVFEPDPTIVMRRHPKVNVDLPSKKLYWSANKPYFKELVSGELIRANIIHCWGRWKTKTCELVAKTIV